MNKPKVGDTVLLKCEPSRNGTPMSWECRAVGHIRDYTIVVRKGEDEEMRIHNFFIKKLCDGRFIY